MNDERSAMLTAAGWTIPIYAQGLLYIETDAETVAAEGERGLFTLTTAAQDVTVRYGVTDGPALARLCWQPDCLEWDGAVRLGGYVDALGLSDHAALGAVVVIRLGAQPLKPGAQPTFTPSRRAQAATYAPLDFFAALADDVPETSSSWLVGEDSPLLPLAHDALMNKLRVWFKGTLAAHKSGWERYFALPLLLEEVTIFAP